MSNPTLTACASACAAASHIASRLLARDQPLLRRSLKQIEWSRALLARPIYPHDPMAPHDPFDFSALKAEPAGDPG